MLPEMRLPEMMHEAGLGEDRASIAGDTALAYTTDTGTVMADATLDLQLTGNFEPVTLSSGFDWGISGAALISPAREPMPLRRPAGTGSQSSACLKRRFG